MEWYSLSEGNSAARTKLLATKIKVAKTSTTLTAPCEFTFCLMRASRELSKVWSRFGSSVIVTGLGIVWQPVGENGTCAQQEHKIQNHCTRPSLPAEVESNFTLTRILCNQGRIFSRKFRFWLIPLTTELRVGIPFQAWIFRFFLVLLLSSFKRYVKVVLKTARIEHICFNRQQVYRMTFMY